MPSTSTILDAVNDVLTDTSQRGGKTEFSENDSSLYIRNRINEALSWIYRYNPTQVELTGSLILTPSTRLIDLPSTLDPYKVMDDSWRVDATGGDIRIGFITLPEILRNYPDFETAESDYPSFVYLNKGKAGFYPMLKAGASDLTIQFDYPAQCVKLTLVTDVFPFTDESDEIAFCKKFAQYYYMDFKGFGAGIDQVHSDMIDLRDILLAKYTKTRKVGIRGHRRYG